MSYDWSGVRTRRTRLLRMMTAATFLLLLVSATWLMRS